MRKKNKVLATALLYVFGWETVLAQVRPVASLPPPPTSDRMGLARGLAVPSVGHRAASTARTPVAPLPIRPGLPLPLAALGPAAASPAASTGPSFPEIRFDLNTWSREGDPSAGTWTVALDGASVIQPQRDDPSVFVSAEDEINTTLRGRLHVGAAAAADGGFVGFVLGYRAPLSTNGDEPSTVDFLLLDWKGRAETRSGFAAQEGLTLARVRGAVTDPVPVFWGHAGEAVTVLGSRYGSGRGWSADRDFAVEISYRRSRIRVSEYDKQNRLVRTTDPDGRLTRTVYDALGKQSQTIDKLGRPTLYEYDAMGRLTRTTHPDGTTDGSTYDAEGRRLTAKDRAGRVTSYEYDALGQLLKTTYPDGASSANEYDADGRLIATRDGRGKATVYGYDKVGRRVSVTDPVGSTTRLAYDKAGNQVSVTDPKGQTRTYEYDGRNRRTKTVFPDGTFTATAYDALGRRRSETDQAGDTTRFEYDCLGRLTKVTDALGQETRYDYDEVGDRVRQTDASGHLTRFEYDRLGRQTKRVLPDGLSEAMAYDGAGNVVSKTDFAGRTTTYAYDSDDRRLGRSYPDGSATSFSYTPTGRRQTATDGRGATTYAYDQRDRLLSLTYPDGRKLDYAYDGNGSRTSLTARIGATSLTTTYAYDDASRLAAVTDPVGRVYGHGYDQNGSRASLAYPDGTATTYGYDRLNRLTSLITTGPLGLVQSYGFTLGPAGNRLRIDEGDGTARAYRYDDLHRLTTETVTRGALPDYEKTFTYDPVGNRRTQATTGAGSPGTPTAPGTSSYTYDERDRLLTETGVNYGSDDNGSLVTKSAEATYVWDFNNWLVRVEKGDGTVVTHAYDADGNRVQTKVTPATGPPTVTNFLLDVAGSLSQVVAETNEGGALEAYYVRGHDLLAVMRPDGGGGFSSRFYHADGLGSVRRLTDETGNITDGYTYTAFGEPIGHTGSDPQPYQFAGEPYSPNIGFAYHRARWMAPSLGRFVSSDPVAGNVLDPPSLHRYTYAADDPVDRIDPTGLQSPAVLGTFIHAHIRGMYPGFGNLLQGAIPGIPEILFPDIADLLTKEVIEIKPLGLYGLSTGPSQLLLYIDALNSVGTYIPWIGTGWHPGLWSPTPGPYIEPRTATTYFVLGNDGGLLFYWAPTRRLPDRVLERVAEKVREAVRDARRVTEQALQQLASQLDVIAIADLIEAAALLSALAVGFYVLAAMMSSVMATRFAFAVL